MISLKDLKMTKSMMAQIILIAVLLASFIFIDTQNKDLDFEDKEMFQDMHFIVNKDSEYILNLERPSDLESIKIDGIVSTKGNAKVYIENNQKSLLIFDSFDIHSDIPEKANNIGTKSPLEIKENKKIGETRSISLALDYGDDPSFDENNDGIEFINGIVDLSVNKTSFSWDVDRSKLCTKWKVYPLDAEGTTQVCYGSEKCCKLIGSTAQEQEWNKDLELKYNTNGVSLSNRITTQVIYSDYNLDIPYSDIISSQTDSRDVKFLSHVSFKEHCLETCNLDGFNKSSYKLIFKISDDAILNLNKITYTTKDKSSSESHFLSGKVSKVVWLIVILASMGCFLFLMLRHHTIKKQSKLPAEFSKKINDFNLTYTKDPKKAVKQYESLRKMYFDFENSSANHYAKLNAYKELNRVYILLKEKHD